MTGLDLSAIHGSPLTDTIKGIPGGTPDVPLRDVARQRWNVLREDMPLPLALVKRSALLHNAEWMRRFAEMTGTALCPHGKTTMSPQIFDLQLRNGAWGITAATVSQVQVLRRFGVARILLANQLIGRQNIRYVLDELKRDPGFDFYCLVDSTAGVQALARMARELDVGRPLQVLIELGQDGGRAGTRSPEQTLAVGREILAAHPYLSLRGVEGYEGILPGADVADMQRRIERLLQDMRAACQRLAQEDLFATGPIILSAGGSAYFDFPAYGLHDLGIAQETIVVLRSGCYVTHDSKWLVQLQSEIKERRPQLAGLGEGPKAALEVWAYVQSMPEPGLVIAGMGKRDCSYDIELPVPLSRFRPGSDVAPRPLEAGHRVTKLNDQHAYVQVPEGSRLQVGDMLAFGISHPCATFDKWAVLPVVNDQYDIVDAIRTFF
jgi:D-serine dehydratase